MALQRRVEALLGVPLIQGYGTTETATIDRWRRFRDDGLDEYDGRRDLPAVDGTSRLSPFLKYGVVHPRQLLAEAGYPDEAAALDAEMIDAALEAVTAHLGQAGDLRTGAIAQGLLDS